MRFSIILALQSCTGVPYAAGPSENCSTRMESPPESIRYARHQVRGCLHGMKLCVAALETDLPPEEAHEFLDHIEHAAGKLPNLLDDLEAVMAQQSEPQPQADSASQSHQQHA